ncbi:Bowman-Birk type proteinase inhibitor-like isoform X2 [Neltuma alba]|uniref:Bowman-Birk type proteinase inhibitor-like isoform X2 n=1 Tax=Neltuma alba TaxID=207710 RepID=UPI0010A3A603|nr:Bowman-Birk type proteinase inhibitor-like isoform X2 [Prosopis alba]
MMMMTKKMVGVVVLLLMALAATGEGRFDGNTLLAEMFKENGEPNYYMKSTTTACCDMCICTRSIPPQCHCTDIGESCHSACKSCLCTRSHPPQCRCVDTTNFCYHPCSSSA